MLAFERHGWFKALSVMCQQNSCWPRRFYEVLWMALWNEKIHRPLASSDGPQRATPRGWEAKLPLQVEIYIQLVKRRQMRVPKTLTSCYIIKKTGIEVWRVEGNITEGGERVT